MDVEGAELDGLPEWLSSGALDHVEQLAMEIHTHEIPPERFKGLLETLRGLYEKGFRVVSYEINAIMGKYRKDYYSLFEVVFMKDTLWN